METTDKVLRDVLTTTRVIAVVGWSPNPDRPSHRVAAFLRARGYRVIPVNPGQAGTVVGGGPGGRPNAGLTGETGGEVVRASLSDIADPVDMVDIFRRASEVGAVVDQALQMPGLRTIWMQLGVIDTEAAARARAAGLVVVMDRCPAIEYPRLIGAGRIA